MIRWNAPQLQQLLGTPLQGAVPAGDLAAADVSTDSRTLGPGALFVALSGAHHDGADFLPAAHARGAAAAIVQRHASAAATAARLPHWAVDDTTVALGQLAADVRRRHGGPVVGITGSNGKTTTKELLAAALGGRAPVHRTHGNLNNAIGVPKTLLAWPEACWAAVVEMGMNAPGEIAYLARLARPTVGLVTCVAAAHLQGLGSVANVAKAKAELFAELDKDATRIVNADDAPLMAAAAPYLPAGKTLRFGRGPDADVQLLACRTELAAGAAGPAAPGLWLQCRVAGRTVEGRLPVLGAHNALNAAAALAAAHALGVDAGAALAAMAHVTLPGGRLAVQRLPARGVHVVDDGYNANPASMRAALQTVRELAGSGRMLAVLGEMRELGAQAEALHAEVGAAAAQLGAAHTFALGALGPALVDGVRAAGGAGEAFATPEALCAALDAALRPGDWILVKGSRGMRMERVVAALAQSAPSPSPSA